MKGIVNNKSNFIPLSQLGLGEEEALHLFWLLRDAFEESHPGRMTDASDAYVLTAFPFGEDDEVPEDYEAVNYATGMYRGEPALARFEGEAVCEVPVAE